MALVHPYGYIPERNPTILLGNFTSKLHSCSLVTTSILMVLSYYLCTYQNITSVTLGGKELAKPLWVFPLLNKFQMDSLRS